MVYLGGGEPCVFQVGQPLSELQLRPLHRLAAFELGKSDPENQDEHIRRQSDYYRAEDVDVIVPLEKLDTFLLHNRLLVLQQLNETADRRFDATDRQKERIRALYEQDYRFMEANRARLF